jgi:isocitrate dehydrogenase
MYRIRPWLYVGKFNETQDDDLLRRREIGAMLQLADSVKHEGIPSLYVPVMDGEPLPPDMLRSGVEFVRLEKALSRNVLIACGAGISRSAAFTVAVLKEEEGLSLLDAFREVRARHPLAEPHAALWESMCEYYEEDVPYAKVLQVMWPELEQGEKSMPRPGHPKYHTVGEIMTNEVATVPASMPVEDALRLMRQRGIHSVIVEPEQSGGAYGIMTQRDLLRKIVAADRPLLNVTVRDLMSSPLITVSPDTTIRQCSIIMLDANIRRAAVMKDGKLVGIISDTDIFQSVEERGWGPD